MLIIGGEGYATWLLQHETVRLDGVSAGHRQPVPGADGQGRIHQGLVVTVKHGRPIAPVPVPGRLVENVQLAPVACAVG
jgi:hypothetical protein